MKKSISTTVLISLMLVNFSFITFAKPIKPQATVYTKLVNVKNFTKLKISGNVKVYLIQSENEGVNIYDNYYSKNALIQQKNDELKITSFEKIPLTVYVYTKNLTSINATDNVVVHTLDTFNLLTLDLILKDNATAFISTNRVSLYSKISDKSHLTLNGSTNEYSSIKSNHSELNTNNFLAEVTSLEILKETKNVYTSQLNNSLDNIDLNNL